MTFHISGCVITRLTTSLLIFILFLSAPARAETIDLRDALQRAVAVAPEIDASNAQIGAAEAGIDQARQRPLPTISLEAQNFPAFGGNRRDERLETTLSYEQRLERGGKREARLGLARREREAAGARSILNTLDLFLTVELAWVEAISAEADEMLAKEKLETARSIANQLSARVSAARDPLFVGARGTAEVNAAQADYEHAREEARARFAELTSFWGDPSPVALEPGAFSVLKPISDDSDLSPDEDLYEAQTRAAAARYELEKTNAVQDPTFSMGVRQFRQDRDTALVFGVSIPLGGSGTNRGNIEQARNNRIVAEKEALAAANSRQRSIARLRAGLQASLSQANRIETNVIPQAKRALDLARNGFARGAFTYLDVMEAEKALIDAKASLNAVRKSFHLDNAQLARLTAQHANLAGKYHE